MTTTSEPLRPTAPAVLPLRAATVAVGLMAGLFFAWDVSVMPGLANLDDGVFLAVLAECIRAIENAAFYGVVVAALVLTAVAAATHRGRARRLIVVALVLYLAALVVTGVVHMPLNQAVLDAVAAGPGADPAAVRATVEQPWRTFNIVRTVLCGLALACLASTSYRPVHAR
ncbi:DUF1772 domain-containing protein [Pseudonocardia sp. HH130630-07]|uniref:DUF1772 domain-containing protein n=1 Tax=Pseudonocardia sp. HH130630-07 TaxID=1690815 RepID=UPI000814E1D7|nr:DUF1772 domain-containing protein [Pseudonocardia sp. HH130630-07]ANY08465.1 hypothetical protein AFB00_21765 [Pseudonocardia sp. HH130630-07]